MNQRTKELILLVIIGAVVGFLVFRASSEGKLPISGLNRGGIINSSQPQVVTSEEKAVIAVVDKAAPSVVAIGATQQVINPFDPFALPKEQQSTIGTGFIVSSKGIIVTNRHVVADTTASYTVVTKDGKKLSITKIYRDPSLDLAIIQVSNGGLQPITLGDSGKLKVGQTAIAIGNALGRFDNTVTTGVVSGLGRSVSAGDPFSGASESLDNLIQTDAAINPGNSGGPLLNSSGEVIGVNVATTQGAQNIGFAFPVNSIKSILTQFETTGTVSRAFLGIRYTFITQDVAKLRNYPQGALIQDVVVDSPAEKAGLKQGDIVTKINGKDITSQGVLSQEIANKKAGESVSLEVWNSENIRAVSVTLAQAPQQ